MGWAMGGGMGEGAWWAWLALTAAAFTALGFALGRLRWRRVAPADTPPDSAADILGFLKTLAAAGAPLDLLPAGADGGAAPEPLARCLLKAAGPEGLSCELLDSAALEAGSVLSCYFAPRRLGGRKVNAFAARVADIDALAEPPRLALELPGALLDLPRRRHARKRVSDQRFVRVRLWLADWKLSRLRFAEAAPDVWVNAYDGRHGGDNAVTDISAGGLALEVRAALVPAGLAPGSPVVLKCSLFQFREKQFRPYWYAGLVRGVSDRAAGMRRIAVAFTAVGRPDEAAAQGVAWEERPLNGSTGGPAASAPGGPGEGAAEIRRTPTAPTEHTGGRA